MPDVDKSELEKLFALQDIDSKLTELKRKMSTLEESSGAKDVAAAVRARKLQLGEIDSQMQGLLRRRDELEDRSKSLIAKVKSMKAMELRGAISHRDIASTEAEISSLESQRSELEDQELEVLAKIEDLEQQESDLKLQVSDEEALLARIRNKNSHVASEFGAEISEMSAQRAVYSGSVDQHLLRIYDDLHARVGSMTLAKVENGNCQGCHLRLSSAEIDGVKKALSGDFTRPPTCEQCGRILYI